MSRIRAKRGLLAARFVTIRRGLPAEQGGCPQLRAPLCSLDKVEKAGRDAWAAAFCGSRGSGILRGGGAESAWRFRPGAASLAPGALEEGSRGGAAVADFGPVAFEEALWAGAIARSPGPGGCLVQ